MWVGETVVLNMNNQLRASVTQVLALLVAGRYADLETLTDGVRLTAKEMSKVINDYGRNLVLPPNDVFDLMNVVEVENTQPRRWSVTVPLWTQEEGRSDLTMEMTVVEKRNGRSIELDDIHVP